MRGSFTRPASWFAGVALATAVALCPVQAVQAAQVNAARVWAGPEYTRVVFDLSGPASYRMRQQDGQVVLELDGCDAAAGFVSPQAQGLYQGVSDQRDGGNLRLITRAEGASPKSFLLKPSGSAGYRLVLDLYPGQATAAPAKTTADSRQAGAATRQLAAHSQAAARAAADAPADAPPAVPVASVSRAPKDPDDTAPLTPRQVAATMQGQRKIIVAIDAGHGGKDTGARGATGTYEKNVTLAVARDLARQINAQPGMSAFLTRDGDFFIPLERRYQIAREHNADMFVSIHADAFINSDAKGSSVWVLSSRGKSNEAARWLADRENRADLIGGVSLDDKNDNLAAVLLDMQQGWAVQASESIAGNVLKALGQLGPTHRGYVERANFVVLRSPDVPSILVETAFITNPSEERKLKNPDHQRALAAAVMGGIRNYFESTPPPGTWFAAQAARRRGEWVAGSRSDDGVAASDARSARQERHRVGRGESLSGIARQYGVSLSALKDANNLSGNTVQTGTLLTIPTS